MNAFFTYHILHVFLLKMSAAGTVEVVDMQKLTTNKIS